MTFEFISILTYQCSPLLVFHSRWWLMKKLASGQSTESKLSVEYSATNRTFMSVLRDY